MKHFKKLPTLCPLGPGKGGKSNSGPNLHFIGAISSYFDRYRSLSISSGGGGVGQMGTNLGKDSS